MEDIVGDVVHMALVDDAPGGQAPYGSFVHGELYAECVDPGSVDFA